MKLSREELWKWFDQHDAALQRLQRYGGKPTKSQRKLINYVMSLTRLAEEPAARKPPSPPPPPKPKPARKNPPPPPDRHALPTVIFDKPGCKRISLIQIRQLNRLGLATDKIMYWTAARATKEIQRRISKSRHP